MAGFRRIEFSLEAVAKEAKEKTTMSAKRTKNPFRKKATSPPRLPTHDPDSFQKGTNTLIPLSHTTSPSSSPPDSSHQRFLENLHQPRKEDLHPPLPLRDFSFQRGLFFDDVHGRELMSEEAIYKSPEARLLKHLEELSKMKPILEAASSVLQELSTSSDSEFADAWRGADRGVKSLEEGLNIISEAQKLLHSPTNGNS